MVHPTTKMADEEVVSVQYAEERWSLLNSLKCTVENIIMSNFENSQVTIGSFPQVKIDLEHIFEHGQRRQQRPGQDKGEKNTLVLVSSFDESVQENQTDANEEILEKLHQVFLDGLLSASNLTELVNKREKINCFYQGKGHLKLASQNPVLLKRVTTCTLTLNTYSFEPDMAFKIPFLNPQSLKTDYAFLRSIPHVEAMCTCIQALENGDCQLLAEIDKILLNKKKYIDLWLQESVSFKTGLLQFSIIDKEIQEKDVEEPTSSNSSGCSNEKNFCQSATLYSSPEDSNIKITDESVYSSVEIQENLQYSPECGHNFSCLLENMNDQSLGDKCLARDRSHREQMVRENDKATCSSQASTTFGSLKTKNSVRATLAYAALSAVFESDEGIPCTAMWRDTIDDRKSSKVRRASTGSLDHIFLHPQTEKVNNGMLDPANVESTSTGSCGKNAIESFTGYQIRKAIGHNRSKSDQLGVTQSQKHEFINNLAISGGNKEMSSSDLNRLSSSLPTTSESQYCIDPYMDDPYQEQSLATILASQDFSSCELDKENAHFSISEALIAAIEQHAFRLQRVSSLDSSKYSAMKCDAVNTSEEEEEEDDEEILYLKKELERKRWEKRQRKHLQEQAAFSDETTQSTASEPSLQTNSSRSVLDSEDELSTEWEELSPTDEQLQDNNEFCTSSATTSHPCSVTDTVSDSVLNPKSKPQYTQLSAEAVAKSLLQKFANQKHPAAWELQWLVSFQDAPQSLLPLPDTVAVAPDDVVEAVENKLMSRQNSLPSRIRGNSEWAPPRAQIIFHTHKPPRRKECMRQQNFRCAGCGMAVSPDYMRRFRYCNYLGKYFCSTCHNNVLEVIPARVLRKWDFTKFEVSNFARDLLHRIRFDPLFNLMDLSPSLYKRIRVLERLKDIRRQLHFFKSFIQTCRKAKELAEEFNKIPDHICGEPHIYSLYDLLQVHDGDLYQFLNKLAMESLNHINHCQLCLAKGFICEYCKDGNDIIFPFLLNRVVQCTGCRASFHKECFVEGKCPKCERIRIRKQVLSEAVSPEEEQTLEYQPSRLV